MNMKCISNFILCAVFSIAQTTFAQHYDFELIGEIKFPTGHVYKEVEMGGLSGITYDSRQDLYYAISDDYGKIAPARFYTLKIAVSDGKLDQGREIVDVELLHYAAAVCIDGLRGEGKDICNLGTWLSLNNQMQHFSLAFSKTGEGAGRISQVGLGEIAVDHLVGDLLAQIAPSSVDGADSLDHLAAS